jgi:hypothetical protein
MLPTATRKSKPCRDRKTAKQETTYCLEEGSKRPVLEAEAKRKEIEKLQWTKRSDQAALHN